jgi:hypothetical protein
VAVAAAGGSAFTAANTGTPLASAGQQATVTTGFTVSDVKYVLDDYSRSDYLITVKFTLTPSGSNKAATQARVRVVGGSDYYPCTVNIGVWSCAINNGTAGSGGVLVNSVNTLDISAVSEPAA